jgi:hypothetical protein
MVFFSSASLTFFFEISYGQLYSFEQNGYISCKHLQNVGWGIIYPNNRAFAYQSLPS